MGTIQHKRTPALEGRGFGEGLVKAGLTGLEPATSGVTDRHSNQLSYSPKPLAERRNIDRALGQFNGGQKFGHLNAFPTWGSARSY